VRALPCSCSIRCFHAARRPVHPPSGLCASAKKKKKKKIPNRRRPAKRARASRFPPSSFRRTPHYSRGWEQNSLPDREALVASRFSSAEHNIGILKPQSHRAERAAESVAALFASMAGATTRKLTRRLGCTARRRQWGSALRMRLPAPPSITALACDRAAQLSQMLATQAASLEAQRRPRRFSEAACQEEHAPARVCHRGVVPTHAFQRERIQSVLPHFYPRSTRLAEPYVR